MILLARNKGLKAEVSAKKEFLPGWYHDKTKKNISHWWKVQVLQLASECVGVLLLSKQWLNCLAVTKTFFFFFFDDQQGKRESRPRSRLLSQVFATQFSPYKHNRADFPIQTEVHHLHEHKQPACLSGTVVKAVAVEITLRFWAKQSRPTSWMWKLVVGNAAEFGYWNPKQGASISYWRQHLLCLKAQSEPRNIHFRVYNKKQLALTLDSLPV